MPELPPMPANHLEFSTTDLPVQLAQKNKHAFSYTYDSYAPALFGFITRTVNDTFAAEEILQNVFVKIWNHADSYCSEKGSLFTWMMAITRNEAITHLRSKTTRKLKRTVTVEGRDKYNRAEGNSREIADDVKRALKLIAQKDRAILELFMQGFSCREIGQMNRMSEGSVKTRMRLSYKKLRLIFS